VGFYSNGVLWRLGKALLSSNVDFFILDENLKPICYSKGVSSLFPSFLKDLPNKIGGMRLIFPPNTKDKTVTFSQYLKTFLDKEAFNVVSSSFLFNDKFSNYVSFNSETSDKTVFLTLSKVENKNILCIVTKTEQKKRGLRQKILNFKNKSSSSLFVANTSHEIRTPIQTILTVMDLLEETNLDAEQAEYTRQIRFGASAILALVNDILDFYKLELGKMKFEANPFNLIDVVENTIDLISMEANKKGLELIVDIDTTLPEFIIGDANRLRQVILNLVKNAVKFTSQGSVSCIVSLSAFQEKENILQTHKPAILFEIKDTGMGISDEKKKKLFDSFYQGEADISRIYGGTGLGLSICKNIIEEMKGMIGCKDNEPHGSIFYFKIPIVQAKMQVSYENILLPSSTKFLIVDDNPRALRVLHEILIKFGFKNITLAETGEQALNMIKTAYYDGSFFDIAFIDMIMPKMDGWRFASEIERFPEIINTHFYLMIPEGTLTGDAKMKLLKWFKGYVYKPIKRRVIFNLLNDIYRSNFEKNDGIDEIVELESIKVEYKDILPSSIPVKEVSLQQNNKDNAEKNKKILVVDDHPVNKQLLKMVLEKMGYVVSTAEDGMEALNKVKNEEFDLIFMDVQMPILDGYEASKKIREMNILSPIIACTAGLQENEKEIALSFGMNDILSKPFTKEELQKVLSKFF